MLPRRPGTLVVLAALMALVLLTEAAVGSDLLPNLFCPGFFG